MESMAAAPAVLYLAYELAVNHWHLRFGNGIRQRGRTIEARDLTGIWQEIKLAKEKLKLPEDALVISCFEAGRDGHWLHRALLAQGVLNLEVGSTSIKVMSRSTVLVSSWMRMPCSNPSATTSTVCGQWRERRT